MTRHGLMFGINLEPACISTDKYTGSAGHAATRCHLSLAALCPISQGNLSRWANALPDDLQVLVHIISRMMLFVPACTCQALQAAAMQEQQEVLTTHGPAHRLGLAW